MAWFADSSPCDYFGADTAPFLRAVGWLENGREYPKGGTQESACRRLLELSNNPWQPLVAMGHHDCDLCQYESTVRSARNLFIPAVGLIYVAPEGIAHYMNAHRYAPPEKFCQAVLVCPDMRTNEHLKAILANGGRSLVKKPGK